MRNPLGKRLPRELTKEFGKYIAIFLFLIGMISLGSGFLVCSHSMGAAYDESFEKYHIEDGNLEFSEEPDADTLADIEKTGKLTLYPNFYKEEDTEGFESTLRIFQKRKDIDLECLMEGEFPAGKGEIAVDRMYADNNDLHVGDSLTAGKDTFRITGLVALSDYSALFSSQSDMMFDAVQFGVAIVTPETFDAVRDTHLHYSYSWIYDNPPANNKAAKTRSEDLLDDLADYLTDKAESEAEELITEAVMRGEDPASVKLPEFLTIKNYIPAYANQAIHFTGDDISGDNAMMTVFLYIMIAVIAFVFAITTSNTITKEAQVIGTLRASGYTRGELVRHYLTVPLIVTLIAAVVGNILGYTVLKGAFADLYYRSYSLPTYKTLWDPEAFIKTTIIPAILMTLINWVVLSSKLRISPLNFMRGDLTPSRKKKAFPLNTKIPILHRFRMRIFFQNIPSYLVVVFGIFFGCFILLFGCAFTPMFNQYQQSIVDNMIAEYQYVLKSPEDPEDAEAEKYLMTSLQTTFEKRKAEDVSIFGMEKDSRYKPLDFASDDAVYISDGFSKKFKLHVGDTFTLAEKYDDGSYTFTIAGIRDYPAGNAVFMTLAHYRDVFDTDADAYTGYFSHHELDLDEENVAMTIVKDDLTKTSRQLIVSMGGMADIVKGFAVIMFVLLIYLLSKIIIERNAQAISMTKILGYTKGEIGGLYILTTTLVVVLSFLICIPLCNMAMGSFIHVALASYPGWFEYHITPDILVKMFLLGMASYAVVAAALIWRIGRIPMADALKNRE